MRAMFQSSAFLSILIFFSKFLLTLTILAVGSSTASVVPGNVTDRLALLSIKDQITEDPLRITSSWNDSLHFCQWQGVTCGRKHQRVTRLNLGLSSLKGSISFSVGNLSFLRNLNLSNNIFHGELPNEIGRLFRLQELVLGNNLFGGRIPASLSNCSELRILALQQNSFTGDIPYEISFLPKLETPSLAVNELVGRIPPHLGNISSLRGLSLVENNLEGEIPASLGQLKSLIGLNLALNKLSGTIPRSIYNSSRLLYFYVGDNELQGSLSHDVGVTLPNIQRFSAWGNQLGGTIPISFSNATELVIFDISQNNFYGRIPDIFGNLKKLERVQIGESKLGYGKKNDLDFITSMTNCSNLQLLRIQLNNFGGHLPNSVGNLSTKLVTLSFLDNGISGNIPPSMGNLISLGSLDLNDNRLTGTVSNVYWKTL